MLFVGRAADDPVTPTELLVMPLPTNTEADEVDKADLRNEPSES